MIPYSRQNIDQKDLSLVVKTLKSDWLTQGPKVIEFEKALAKSCGARYAVAVSSGTAALHLAYLVAGLKPGDEVITTPNTFVATANMLLVVGAKPVFCDIRLDTYNLDERKIESLITKKTKAIVPVHLGGHPCEMSVIWRLAQKYKLKVIEDSAHALGARYRGKPIGSGRSDLVVFSFHPVKSITTGEGGAIVTNNYKYYQRLRLLRSHGIYKDKSGKNVMIALGYNYRLTDIQAALGLSQLKKLGHFIRKRQQISRWYQQALKDMKHLALPQQLKLFYSSWHLYLIRLKNEKIRDGLAKYLKNRGIGINFHYPCLYQQPYYRRKQIGGRCKNAEKYAKTILTIPCYPGLEKTKIEHIAKLIEEFLGRV